MRDYIKLLTNSNANHNFVVAHTTNWSWPKRLIEHKARLNAKPNTRHKTQQSPSWFESGEPYIQIWRYYVVIVIHFIDETYLKVTPLPIYEAPNPYIPQPCHYILVFLHLSNLGRRLPFASQLPPAGTYVVTPTRLLGLPLVLWLTTIKFAMVLHALHKHCHRYGLPSIIGYDSSIHRCLLLETNRLHITVMVLSGFSPTHHNDLPYVNHRL